VGGSPEALRDFVERVDALGYDSVWLGESWGEEAFSQLGWIAALTRRIRIGVGIVNVFSRSPALIGQAAATMDRLSGGRFLLGLGTSGRAVVENWHSIPYERPLRRLRESIEVIRLVTSGERVSYDGELFHLKGLKLLFPPVRPRIPIYVASLGAQNIRQTGELADGWNPIFLDPAALPRFRAELAKGAERADRDVADVAIAPQVIVLVSDDLAEARRYAAAHIGHYICRMGVYYARHIAAQGFAEEVERVQKTYAESGDFATAVPDHLVDALAVVGPARRCRERLEEYAAAGATMPSLTIAQEAPASLARATLEALAPARM
jgi:F420-dependent oxidoreductase-like protein